MADTKTRQKRSWAKNKRIDRRLPASASIEFGKACFLCRKMPRVQGKGGKGVESMHISDGVMVPQTDCTFEGREVHGNYKIRDRWVSGSHIEVKHHKVMGSHNHHKFLVVITNGVVS